MSQLNVEGNHKQKSERPSVGLVWVELVMRVEALKLRQKIEVAKKKFHLMEVEVFLIVFQPHHADDLDHHRLLGSGEFSYHSLM